MSLTFGFVPQESARWLGHASGRSTKALSIIATVFAVSVLAVVSIVAILERQKLFDSQQEVAQRELMLSAHDQARTLRNSSMSKQQILAYNTLATQLNTPWSNIFDTLERNTPEDVALVQIEPDGQRRSIRIQAEAKTIDHLLQYAESLKRDPAVKRILLIQQETNEQDANRPVRLTLDARIVALNTPAP